MHAPSPAAVSQEACSTTLRTLHSGAPRPGRAHLIQYMLGSSMPMVRTQTTPNCGSLTSLSSVSRAARRSETSRNRLSPARSPTSTLSAIHIRCSLAIRRSRRPPSCWSQAPATLTLSTKGGLLRQTSALSIRGRPVLSLPLNCGRQTRRSGTSATPRDPIVRGRPSLPRRACPCQTNSGTGVARHTGDVLVARTEHRLQSSCKHSGRGGTAAASSWRSPWTERAVDPCRSSLARWTAAKAASRAPRGRRVPGRALR